MLGWILIAAIELLAHPDAGDDGWGILMLSFIILSGIADLWFLPNGSASINRSRLALPLRRLC